MNSNKIIYSVFISEIAWREFYQMILCQFPAVEKMPFKEKYKNIKWKGSIKELNAWKNGKTGYPIIDAAMRCLNTTGLMPNRLRMVTASFLCKTLLVDWKKGEKYFAKKLLDYDLAANNGGWQWCSSSGCDSQPYFRIFNPYSQSKKFDPEGSFIRKWCPELKNLSNNDIHQPPSKLINYPTPIVDYKKSRTKALKMYKRAIG